MTDTRSPKNIGQPAVDEDLILIGIKASTPEAVLSFIGDRLLEKGYVKDSFKDAVIEREHESPTGLPSPVPVAIPHADAEHNRRSALAVGVLQEPVDFGLMGTDDQTIPVQLVFMLTLTDPKAQVKWLGRLIEFFRQPDLLEGLLEATSPEQVASSLRRHLFSDNHHGSE